MADKIGPKGDSPFSVSLCTFPNPNKIPDLDQTGLVFLQLALSIISSFFNSLKLKIVKFHHVINILKSILYKNSYPRGFVDKSIKGFLDRVLMPKLLLSTVPKKDLMIVLPYWVNFCFKFALELIVK